MKKVITNIILFIISSCIIGSLFISTVRVMGKSNGCSKLNIDRLEPVISTRWFREVDK